MKSIYLISFLGSRIVYRRSKFITMRLNYMKRKCVFMFLLLLISYPSLLGFIIRADGGYRYYIKRGCACGIDNTEQLSSITAAATPTLSTSLFGNVTREQEDRIREIGGPSFDLQLIAKTIEQWSKPLPPSYVNKPLVLAGKISLKVH